MALISHSRVLSAVIACMLILRTCGLQQTQSDEQLPQPVPFINTSESIKGTVKNDPVEPNCPTNVECSQLPGSCLDCTFNESCVYGQLYNVTCIPKKSCTGERVVEKTMVCRYCYQTEHWEHTCVQKANCNSVASPKAYYRTNCSVKDDIICLGRRRFYKNLPCNWTGGYRWSTAFALSITLGGFGADRFYLGHWQEGIGKLFSFGGLGVWTLIDVILITLHYLGPADGSLFL